MTLMYANMAIYNPKTRQLGFVHIDECSFDGIKNIFQMMNAKLAN